MNATIMGCGCAAQGTIHGAPACIPHYGLHPGATTVISSPALPPDRMATCPYCKTARPSQQGLTGELAFWQFRPERETDSYYCGCRGWD